MTVVANMNVQAGCNSWLANTWTNRNFKTEFSCIIHWIESSTRVFEHSDKHSHFIIAGI